MPQKLTLVSTIHDPGGRLLPALIERSHHLGQYDAVHIAATDVTAPRVLEALRTAGAHVLVGPAGAAGMLQRDALDAAMNTGRGPFFYCDFDRWLHWAGRFPEELASLADSIGELRPPPWHICVGRTRRAFDTHPRVQRDAEQATNHVLGLALGCCIDATAGACWLSREGAAIVLDRSIESSKAVDLEWPGLVFREAPGQVASLLVEGLEFETAAFYSEEVRAAGGTAAWVQKTYDQPDVWHDRLRLATDSINALVRVLR